MSSFSDLVPQLRQQFIEKCSQITQLEQELKQVKQNAQEGLRKKKKTRICSPSSFCWSWFSKIFIYFHLFKDVQRLLSQLAEKEIILENAKESAKRLESEVTIFFDDF